MKVLVCHSDSRIRAVVDAACRRRHYAVSFAESCAAVCELLQRSAFDLVIVEPPRESSISEVKRIRCASGTDDVYLLATFVTGPPDALLDAGADDLLGCPVDEDTVDRRLAVFERWHARRETGDGRTHRDLREALELNRRILEAMPGGIVHVSTDGAVLRANEKAVQILGLSYDELTRRYTSDFGTATVHEDGSPCLPSEYPVTLALQTGLSQPPMTIGVRRPDGAVSWAVFTAVPVLDPETGAPSGVVVTFLDITERKAVEHRILESEERYRELVERSPDPMFIVADGLIAFINTAGVRLIGADRPSELLGAPFESVILPGHRAMLDEHTRRLLAGERLLPVEEKLVRKDGSTVDVELAEVPFAYNDQPAIQVVARDITERKESAERLRRLEAQMQHTQRLESLGLLAGGIAHDFNNLLAAILGNAGLARLRLPADAPALTAVDKIEGLAQRAAGLTNQMLAYSGRGRFVVEPVDLTALVHEMAELLETVRSKKAQLHFEDGGPAVVEADVAQLQQVVMNLITNASDAVGDGAGAITVRTGSRHLDRRTLSLTWLDERLPEGNYAFLEVQDTGCGMDEQTRMRLFDPFFTTKINGRGLGLAATLGIIRGHRGAVRVESELGRGTLFQVYLPAAEVEVRRPVVPGPTARSERRSATVLVVDDEAAVREVATLILGEFGHTVLTAACGRDAVAMFAESGADIDVVLLDMTMPDMSGDEVLRELRRMREDVRVILQSGYTEHEVVERLPGATVSGFLQKPYRATALLSRVQQALR